MARYRLLHQANAVIVLAHFSSSYRPGAVYLTGSDLWTILDATLGYDAPANLELSEEQAQFVCHEFEVFSTADGEQTTQCLSSYHLVGVNSAKSSIHALRKLLNSEKQGTNFPWKLCEFCLSSWSVQVGMYTSQSVTTACRCWNASCIGASQKLKGKSRKAKQRLFCMSSVSLSMFGIGQVMSFYAALIDCKLTQNLRSAGEGSDAMRGAVLYSAPVVFLMKPYWFSLRPPASWTLSFQADTGAVLHEWVKHYQSVRASSGLFLLEIQVPVEVEVGCGTLLSGFRDLLGPAQRYRSSRRVQAWRY